MINNTTPNIQYSDRIGHRYKSRVIEDKLSAKNSFHETPLKRESSDISFKGVSSLKKAIGFYNTKDFDLKRNMELLEKALGKRPKEFYEHFKREDWEDIQKNIKETLPGTVTVRTKNWTKLLLEGIAYPVTELPLHIYKGIKELVIGKTAPIQRTKEEMLNRNLLQKEMDILNNSDIINSFSGMMETASKLKHDNDAVQKASIFTKAMKQFDQKAGNYNGVHERALTRIVTGFIPAFFLANDAYNLSRLCDDDPKKAKVEHDTRFNQETKRVVSNAYLQLITLGALSKYINAKKWVFVLVTAATVLLTEAYSRVSNGKKIYFISKEDAKRINKENAQKNAEEAVQPQSAPETPTKTEKAEIAGTKAVNFKGSKVFKGFGMAADMPISTETTPKTNEKQEKEVISNSEKPLISLESITKWFITMIAAGFAMKYAKKNLVLGVQKQTLGKYLDVISKKVSAKYDKLTLSEYKINKSEFDRITDRISAYDATIGAKFKSVAEEYQQSSKIKREAENIAKKLEDAGFGELAKGFRHLKNLGKTTNFADMTIQQEAKDYFTARNKIIINKELKDLFKLLEENNLSNEAGKLKELLYPNDVLELKNYTIAKKYVDKTKELKDFRTTFENRFKVNENEETIKMLDNAVAAVRESNADLANELNRIKAAAINSTEYTFGKRNRALIKGFIGRREVFDFITQPFKFLWGTITLPYKHVANRIYQLKFKQYDLPKWDAELDAVYNGIKKLTYKSPFKRGAKARIDFEDKDFVRYMDERINKAFNAATMSSISNADLSALAKNTSTFATAGFLLCDNHNMVMLKSNGEDKEGAVLKAKERAIQETSRTFWNVLFINLFNDTFRNTFNSSLLGAQAVNTASTLVGEYVNRKAIGMPVAKKSKSEILDKEREYYNNNGIKGDLYRFMSRLTGKKVLSERNQSQGK